MKLKRDQAGFGGLEIMLILAVLLTVAGIGSFVYSQHHKNGGLALGNGKAVTPVKYNGSANSSAPNGVPSGATSTNPSSGRTDTQNLNVIKVTNGGFQISVPNSLSDLTYHVSSSGSTTTVTFSTASLTRDIPACSADSGSGAFDTIIKGSGTFQGNNSTVLIKQYSGYYLAYVLPNAPCAHNLSPANQAVLDSQAQDFTTALQTVQSL